MNLKYDKPPLEVTALAIDVTGSMAQTDWAPSRLGAAEDAAIEFIKRKRLIDAHDINTVVAYNTSARQVSAFGRHPVEVVNDIKGLTANGGTNITAGLKEALDLVVRCLPKQGDVILRIILLSDGEHNTGSGPREDGVLDRARHARVIIDTVLIGRDGERLLRDIAAATGGTFVQVSDFKTLLAHYQMLALKKTPTARP
jgi:Ca-activated chloride channel family protein